MLENLPNEDNDKVDAISKHWQTLGLQLHESL